MSTIKINVSKMFAHIEPWDCSNSQANLGPKAAQYTWAKSLQVAGDHQDWLLSSLSEAQDHIRSWARETGAWTQAEIDEWSDEECLALLVQNVASDMRALGSDDFDLPLCVNVLNDGSQVQGWYWLEGDQVFGEL